jgi:hypothetical protein
MARALPASTDMDATDLQERITRMLVSGELPCDEEVRTWAGPGLDRVCSACGKPITRGQTEFELDFGREPAVQTFRFHRDCYGIWQLRRQMDC